jgi:hypothetical protein
MKTLLIILLFATFSFSMKNQVKIVEGAYISKNIRLHGSDAKESMKLDDILELNDKKMLAYIDSAKSSALVKATNGYPLNYSPQAAPIWCAVYDRYMVKCSFYIKFFGKGTGKSSLFNFKDDYKKDMIIAKAYINDIKTLLAEYKKHAHKIVKEYEPGLYQKNNGEFNVTACVDIQINKMWEDRFRTILTAYHKYLIYENASTKKHMVDEIERELGDYDLVGETDFTMYYKNASDVPKVNIKLVDDNGSRVGREIQAVGYKNLRYRLFRVTSYDQNRDLSIENRLSRSIKFGRISNDVYYNQKVCKTFKLDQSEVESVSKVVSTYK